MKNRIIVILGAVVIIAALIAMVIFVFGDGNNAENQKKENIVGTWQVVSGMDENLVFLPEKEFIIFSKDSAKSYKNGEKEPYAESVYEIDKDDNLILPDISQQYVMDLVTENIMALYKSDVTSMYLIKYPNADMSEVIFDMTTMDGKWQVICHGGNTVVDEVFVFDNGTLDYYRNGETKPVASYEYSITENCMSVEELSLNVVIHKVAEKSIILVEMDTGYVWELNKQE